MTVGLIESLGWSVEREGSEGKADGGDEWYRVVTSTENRTLALAPEPDWSAGFTLACLAAVENQGCVQFNAHDTLNFSQTRQPDRAGFEILQKCGVSVLVEDGCLTVRGSDQRSGVEVDLASAPDLFPCLAAVLATAQSPSKISGAAHLAFKESNRVAGISQLFRLLGVGHDLRRDGLIIRGAESIDRSHWRKRQELQFAYEFSPDHDHRLAFAAAVLAQSGAPVQCLERGVVEKSHPGFWALVEGDAPRYAVIGHRGSGKTRFAKKLASILRGRCVDLDLEIDASHTLATIGEPEFRKLEKQRFDEIERETRDALEPTVISVGGGFDPAAIPSDIETIWVRRVTDRGDRIFLDRPRLDPELSPEQEWRNRRDGREIRFFKRFDRVIEVAEGADQVEDSFETAWCRDLAGESALVNLGGVVSITHERSLVPTLHRLLRWGVGAVEFRDDLIRSDDAWDVARFLPPEKLLVSFRDPNLKGRTQMFLEEVASDAPNGKPWADVPLRFGHHSRSVRNVMSVHDADIPPNETWRQAADRAEVSGPEIVKVAVSVKDFSTLKAGHEWSQASAQRVFLPMGDGRWEWYRSLPVRSDSQLHERWSFWREGDGTSVDQPTLGQWMRERFGISSNRKWAAVLGDPVLHSRTPLEHRVYFAQHMAAVRAVTVRPEEFLNAIEFLTSLGLFAAAVTSPLKEVAAKFCDADQPVNTLWYENKTWRGTSTDAAGFRALLDRVQEALGAEAEVPRVPPSILVFGGGGVLPALKSVAPAAEYLTKRSPQLNRFGFDVLVWATGADRGRWDEVLQALKASGERLPRVVVDLSYGEDSAGRRVSQELRAKYVSGLAMFSAQAQAQRVVWTNQLFSSSKAAIVSGVESQ